MESIVRTIYARPVSKAIPPSDSNCDDGLFCNGVESCQPNDGNSDAADVLPVIFPRRRSIQVHAHHTLHVMKIQTLSRL